MQPSARPLFYDLSELFINASARVKIYGVVRVIAEIGLELQRSHADIRFVVFSPGHQAFFEVHPRFDRLHDDDAVDLGLSPAARPRPLRSVFHRWRWLRRLSYWLAAPLVHARNRRRWKDAGVGCKRADMTGALLISAARPKYIVEYLKPLQGAGAQLVAMLHDMIPLHHSPATVRHPNFGGDNRAILRAAAMIIANSDFTRADILRFVERGLLPAPAQIPTVRLAHECRQSNASPGRPVPEGAYFLCVGSAVGRKNLNVVFDALTRLTRAGQPLPFSLVLAGHTGTDTRTCLAHPAYDHIRTQVVLFDAPSHAELLQLYRQATAVIVPTRIEGWGLPAGEALWLGTPLVCADIPALYEAGHGLALYFDPDAPDALALLLTRLVDDPAFRDEQRHKIRRARHELRSWARVASELLATVHLHLNGPSHAYPDTRSDTAHEALSEIRAAALLRG